MEYKLTRRHESWSTCDRSLYHYLQINTKTARTWATKLTSSWQTLLQSLKLWWLVWFEVKDKWNKPQAFRCHFVQVWRDVFVWCPVSSKVPPTDVISKKDHEVWRSWLWSLSDNKGQNSMFSQLLRSFVVASDIFTQIIEINLCKFPQWMFCLTAYKYRNKVNPINCQVSRHHLTSISRYTNTETTQKSILTFPWGWMSSTLFCGRK